MASKTIICDVLIVGAGLAGERAAIESAAKGLDVIILSLVPPRRSHSTAAQGGCQASLGNSAMGEGDNTDIHFTDTVKGSDWGCDQAVARLFAETAPHAVRQMAYWGVPWNTVTAGKRILPDGMEIREKDEKSGLINARDFGGTAKWRTCYTSDGTGHSLQYAVDSMTAKLGIRVHQRMEAISLIHNGEKCLGVVARCLVTGELTIYLAKATAIATGGYGRLYGASTNAIINEGTGMAIAMDTGLVPLGNMEAVQFHPTGLVPVWILITEGARGDGGFLLDKNLHRFMPDYEPKKKDLASRDVVSRRMIQHIRKGLGVESPYGQHLWLDIRHLGAKHINANLREIKNICLNFTGINPIDSLIPVRPTQHYSMGGIRTDINGRAYGLKGLFSLGEAACWDLHGFNRLGGNSLAETIVSGWIVGKKIAEYAQGIELNFNFNQVEGFAKSEAQKINKLINCCTGKENVFVLRKEMEDVLTDNVGIFRNGTDLQAAVIKLQELHERSEDIQLNGCIRTSPELTLALRLPGMIRLALCISQGALMRTESRGSHAREDYPKRDDVNWLKRTLAYWKKDAVLPDLDYEPVNITELPPGDRGYGESADTDNKQ